MKQAKCIELLLFNDASTYDEYKDRSTFNRRFIEVIHNYQIMNDRSREIDDSIIELSKRFNSL